MKRSFTSARPLVSALMFSALAPAGLHAANIAGDTVTTNFTALGSGLFTGRTLWLGSDDTYAAAARLNWTLSSANTTDGTFYFDLPRLNGRFEWRDSTETGAKRMMVLSHTNELNLYKADGTTIGLILRPESNQIDVRGSGGIYSNGTPLLTVGSGAVPTFASMISTGDATFNNVKIGTGAGNIASNTVVGTTAMTANTSGAFNSAFGDNSLEMNTTGANNSALGSAALADNTSGSNNAGVGVGALGGNTTGSYNTGIGQAAGMYRGTTGTNLLTAPANCVFIGAGSRGAATNDTNAIVIGVNAVSEGSNTAVIGGPAITKTVLKGTTQTQAVSVGQNLTVAGATTLSGATTAAAVNAGSLAVSGATTLSGPVILAQPQGDISMGIYQ